MSDLRFAELWRDYRAPVLTYLLRRVSEPADAADLLAETFLVAWRRPAAVPDGEQARLWLYGIASKQLGNHRRGSRRHRALVSELSASLLITPSTPPASAAVDAVRDAMRELPSKDREVLLLTCWEGLTAPEIAVVLGIAPDAVRSRLTRARQRLRDRLEDDQERQPLSAQSG